MLNGKFVEGYNDCRDTLMSTYLKTVSVDSLEVAKDDLKAIICVSVEKMTGKEEKEQSEEECVLFEFLTLSCLNAYRGASNIDVARLTESQFGFKDCCSVLSAFENISGTNKVSSKNLGRTAMAQLLSVMRECSFEEYVSNEYYVKDLENIQELLKEVSDRKVTTNDEVLKQIDIVMDYAIKSSLKLIKERYSFIMEGTFGIEDYKGVYTGGSVAVYQGVNGYGKAEILQPDDSLGEYFGQQIGKYLNVRFCNKRQFSHSDIFMGYNDDPEVPVYFPYKILELISKCKFTKNTALLNYRKIPKAEQGTKDSYIDKYILKPLSEDMVAFLYEATYSLIESFYDDLEGERGTKERKKSVEARAIKVFKTKDTQTYRPLTDYLAEVLRYYADCVSCAVVLDKLTTARNKSSQGYESIQVIEFRAKICSKVFKGLTNYSFVQNVTSQMHSTVDDLNEIDDSEFQLDRGGFSQGNLTLVIDSDKVNARPVFAYKALQALKEQTNSDKPLSWQNILLGRDLSDQLVTSHSGGNIALQDTRVHYIISGSRSGKGVMCYNIFATAIGSQIPMFYLDRKPDTATVLQELAPNMFCFNGGGNYDEAIDYKGIFDRSKSTFQIPAYLAQTFEDEGVRFDYAYFRGIMLVLSMMVFADSGYDCELRSTLRDKFSNGLVLVMDEFTNFFENFLGSNLTAEGGRWFNNIPSTIGISKDASTFYGAYLKAKENLVKKEAGKNVNQASIDIANEAVTDAQRTYHNEFNLKGLYMSALADSYKEILDIMKELKKASGDVFKKTHIFVIGQDFKGIYQTFDRGEGKEWFNLGGGTNRNKFNSSNNIVPLISALNSVPVDVITGYQKDDRGYLAQGNASYRTNKLLNASRRCFAYKRVGSLSEDNLDALMNTEGHFSGGSSIREYLNTWAYFKPFLILNNSIQPPMELIKGEYESKEAKESVFRGRSAASDGNFYKDSQFVGQCILQCEGAGISWEDLLNDNPSGEDGVINSGVGFEGYITMLNGGIPTESMNLSGQLADMFVKEVFGYTGTWREFLCDFRPEYIITPRGILKEGSTPNTRLVDTFFNETLIRKGFATMVDDRLESLRSYYGDVDEESSVTLSDIAKEEFDEPIEFGDSSEESVEEEQTPVGSPQIYSEPSFEDGDEEDVFSGLGNNDRMSDSDIREVAVAIISATGLIFKGEFFEMAVEGIISLLRRKGW